MTRQQFKIPSLKMLTKPKSSHTLKVSLLASSCSHHGILVILSLTIYMKPLKPLRGSSAYPKSNYRATMVLSLPLFPSQHLSLIYSVLSQHDGSQPTPVTITVPLWSSAQLCNHQSTPMPC